MGETERNKKHCNGKEIERKVEEMENKNTYSLWFKWKMMWKSFYFMKNENKNQKKNEKEIH